MINTCLHCGQDIDNIKQFCCNGCEAAYILIHHLQLEKFYEYCLKIHGVKPMKALNIITKVDYSDEVISLNNDSKKLHLLIEGMHCGSCVWLIESSVRKFPEVTSANINLSTKRLVITWEGDAGLANNYAKHIMELGYKVVPFTPDQMEEQALQEERNLLIKVGVSGLASVAMMMMLWGVWAGNFDHSMGHYTRFITHVFAAIIALPAIVYTSWPFMKSAYYALLAGRTNMDTPIAIGIITTTLMSVYQVITQQHYTYFDAAISLIFFLLVGRFLDLKTRNKARGYATNLLLSQPKVITLCHENQMILVPLKAAKIGDVAFIAVGEKIPADGVITEGSTQVDNSLISGESIPIEMSIGHKVIAGTLNIGSPIKIRIEALGEATTLGEIIKLVEIAGQSKAQYVRIADQLARYFTPIVLILGTFTFLWWYYIAGTTFSVALNHAIALIIVTCPCALGLAVPAVMVAASSALMKQGIMPKTPDVLEKLAQIKAVAFDKTGTLTEGEPICSNLDTMSPHQLAVAYALASSSKHPLSKALCRALQNHETLPKLTTTGVKEISGQGVAGKLDGHNIAIGSRRFCGPKTQNAQRHIDSTMLEMWLTIENQDPVCFLFTDQIKEDAIDVVRELATKFNLELQIISGDQAHIVAQIADAVNIDNWQAEQTPTQKYKLLANAGRKTLMVGDGLNDAAALEAAFVSMSPTSSLEIAQTRSDIIFHGKKLYPIITTYKTALLAQKLIKQNFALSLFYNLISVPMAMLGMLNPIVAAILMSSSSIMVVLNALRANAK
jgi:Cu2+-exporting ATPase